MALMVRSIQDIVDTAGAHGLTIRPPWESHVWQELPRPAGPPAWEDKSKRLLLRLENLQRRLYAMKLMAYTLINVR
jgi:hypothetical protein